MPPDLDDLDNLSAPPKAEIGRVEPPPGVELSEEAIRRAHIGRERAIKALAWFPLIFGALCGLSSAAALLMHGLFVTRFGPKSEVGVASSFAGEAAEYGTFAAICLLLGLGLRWLRDWARLTWILLAAFLLTFGIVVNIGMGIIEKDPLKALAGIASNLLLTGPILAVLLPRKAARICSEEYRWIVAATPHVRNRTNRGTILVLVIVAVIVIALIAGVISSG